MLYNEDILIENIKKKGNDVLIWGACKRNNEILDFFNQHDVNVVGYIDQNADKLKVYNNLPVYNKDIIKSDDFFVYVGLLKTYEDIISYFEDNNYKEFVDYWYPCRVIILDGSHSYEDLYGNECVVRNINNIQIKLSNGGKLFIGDKCSFDNLNVEVSNMSELRIGSGTFLVGHTYIFSNCFSKIDINENGTSTANLFIVATRNSKISIGKDCMFARDVVLRAGHSHNMFDLENKENISVKGCSVIIGDHVWVGQRAILFNGCNVGNGSIIGINCFVNKSFPPNCSVAGNPARIIKENIAWRREDYPFFNSYNDFAEYDFR